MFVCDICYSDGRIVPATISCSTCTELYCKTCSDYHKSSKATKSHQLDQHDDLSTKKNCEPCMEKDKSVKVPTNLCIECDEALCTDCTSRHQKMKATRNHVLIKSSETTDKSNPEISTKPKRDNTTTAGKKTAIDTEDAYGHSNDIEPSEEQLEPTNPEDRSILIDERKEQTKNIAEIELINRENTKRPGKPYSCGSPSLDNVRIAWNPPKVKPEDSNYQLRFKEQSPSAKWTFHPDLLSENTVQLNNLKSKSKFVFQIRMVDDETEGPYSELSDPVETIASAAEALLGFTRDVKGTDGILIKKLTLKENIRARNEKGKTRKMVLGNTDSPKERTILMIGASGTGKSTLVDGMINYILGVKWNDPYRFTLVDLEDEEKTRNVDQALSQTQWITCYNIGRMTGGRLNYTLNIIDTPGFGDTSGYKRDREIVEQIKHLFTRKDEAGVVNIDAICFVIKAPDARLTPTQRYIFESIMALFGKDIETNFSMLITFADGKQPPVLSALEKAKLPHGDYFTFNNSGLFADNSCVNTSDFSSMYWNMGCKSFEKFFERLNKMETKSLRQTRDVLLEREKLENTIEILRRLLDAGLNKVEELRKEIDILEQHKTEIDANKNFKYKVTETHQKQIPLPKGRHVTNCLHCNFTCHDNCIYADDKDKSRCCAMTNGKCTQCPDKCMWNIHKNTPYTFRYDRVEVEKTYEEKLKKYRRATGESMTREKVVDRMDEEVKELELSIDNMLAQITECNTKLKEIALRPDPLSLIEHIDILIKSEEQEKRPGFIERIDALKKCRKRATITDDITRFRTGYKDTQTKIKEKKTFTHKFLSFFK